MDSSAGITKKRKPKKPKRQRGTSQSSNVEVQSKISGSASQLDTMSEVRRNRYTDKAHSSKQSMFSGKERSASMQGAGMVAASSHSVISAGNAQNQQRRYKKPKRSRLQNKNSNADSLLMPESMKKERKTSVVSGNVSSEKKPYYIPAYAKKEKTSQGNAKSEQKKEFFIPSYAKKSSTVSIHKDIAHEGNTRRNVSPSKVGKSQYFPKYAKKDKAMASDSKGGNMNSSSSIGLVSNARRASNVSNVSAQKKFFIPTYEKPSPEVKKTNNDVAITNRTRRSSSVSSLVSAFEKKTLDRNQKVEIERKRTLGRKKQSTLTKSGRNFQVSGSKNKPPRSPKKPKRVRTRAKLDNMDNSILSSPKPVALAIETETKALLGKQEKEINVQVSIEKEKKKDFNISSIGKRHEVSSSQLEEEPKKLPVESFPGDVSVVSGISSKVITKPPNVKARASKLPKRLRNQKKVSSTVSQPMTYGKTEYNAKPKESSAAISKLETEDQVSSSNSIFEPRNIEKKVSVKAKRKTQKRKTVFGMMKRKSKKVDIKQKSNNLGPSLEKPSLPSSPPLGVKRSTIIQDKRVVDTIPSVRQVRSSMGIPVFQIEEEKANMFSYNEGALPLNESSEMNSKEDIAMNSNFSLPVVKKIRSSRRMPQMINSFQMFEDKVEKQPKKLTAKTLNESFGAPPIPVRKSQLGKMGSPKTSQMSLALAANSGYPPVPERKTTVKKLDTSGRNESGRLPLPAPIHSPMELLAVPSKERTSRVTELGFPPVPTKKRSSKKNELNLPPIPPKKRASRKNELRLPPVPPKNRTSRITELELPPVPPKKRTSKKSELELPPVPPKIRASRETEVELPPVPPKKRTSKKSELQLPPVPPKKRTSKKSELGLSQKVEEAIGINLELPPVPPKKRASTKNDVHPLPATPRVKSNKGKTNTITSGLLKPSLPNVRGTSGKGKPKSVFNRIKSIQQDASQSREAQPVVKKVRSSLRMLKVGSQTNERSQKIDIFSPKVASRGVSKRTPNMLEPTFRPVTSSNQNSRNTMFSQGAQQGFSSHQSGFSGFSVDTSVSNNNQPSSEALRSQFTSASTDKFRQSFWKKKQVKNVKPIRASLALIRNRGKLQPLLPINANAGDTEDLSSNEQKTLFQKRGQFRESFWNKKTKKREKKSKKPSLKLSSSRKLFAGILESTLNKTSGAPGEGNVQDVGQLDVDQSLLSSTAQIDEEGKVDYKPYLKLCKLRLPDGAIRQKMMREQLTDEQIEYFFEHVKNNPASIEKPVEATNEEDGNEEPAQVKLLEKAGMTDYKKYIMLVKSKLPKEAIIHAMNADELSEDNKEFFLANIDNVGVIQPPDSRFPKLNLEDQRGDWDYSKYKKLFRIKVPKVQIEREMESGGLSPENIEFFFANVEQLDLIKSEDEIEEENAKAAESAFASKPDFLSAIEGLNGNKNNLKKASLRPKIQKKKSVKKKSEPTVLSELKKQLEKQRVKTGGH